MTGALPPWLAAKLDPSLPRWEAGPIVAEELDLLHAVQGLRVEAIHRMAIRNFVTDDDHRFGDLHFFEFGEGSIAITFVGHTRFLHLWNHESARSLAVKAHQRPQPIGNPDLDEYQVVSSSHQFELWEWVHGHRVIESGLLEWDDGGQRRSDGLYLRLDRPMFDSPHTEILIGVKMVTTNWIDLAQAHHLAPNSTKNLRRYAIETSDGSSAIAELQ